MRRVVWSGQVSVFAFLLWVLPFTANSEVANWAGSDFSGLQCTGQGNRHRDYTDKRPGPMGREFLPVVEKKHFGPEIRNLVLEPRTPEGKRAGIERIAGELNYVLGQYPNHHDALYLMSQFPAKIIRRFGATQEESWLGRDENPVYSAVIVLSETYKKPRYECYFLRAIAWRPKDPVLHVLYGVYSHKTGRNERAEQHYREAISLRPSYADAHYNLGLLFLELEQYEEAREAARKAYRLGYQLPALERRLTEAGYPLE